MKNLLLLLLLANILYFLWGLTRDDQPEPGVVVFDESDLGPPLSVAQKPEAKEVASVGALLATEQPSELVAMVGRSCVTVGPFRDMDDAVAAKTRYASVGMDTEIRSGTGQFFVGHWVQIRDIPSREESRRMIAVLKDAGLTDAYPVETEDEGLKISLGLFGNLASAEKIELEAKSLGLNADITPRTSEGPIHWVDLALPPGKGAGEIMERYGEDKVLLRSKATCPKE
ncbi:MAG TPA: SPOR domain-containing protein [Woeseiaceae bacterium]|nr:SPOR domain-containing protein [Woeseiaceae bacterium]